CVQRLVATAVVEPAYRISVARRQPSQRSSSSPSEFGIDHYFLFSGVPLQLPWRGDPFFGPGSLAKGCQPDRVFLRGSRRTGGMCGLHSRLEPVDLSFSPCMALPDAPLYLFHTSGCPGRLLCLGDLFVV